MYVEQYWSHSYIPVLIRSDGVVIDIGFYGGGFSERIAARCRRVVAFEPDPRCQGVPAELTNVVVIPKAIGGNGGLRMLSVNTDKCSSFHHSDAASPKIAVETVTFEDALRLVPSDRIDLVKMDIEGEELAVLSTASASAFDRIVQVTVEFHDFLDPQSLPEIRSVIARMETLGFATLRFSWRNYGDILFVNRNLVRITQSERLWMLARYKYVRGLVRLLRRNLFERKTASAASAGSW